MNNNDETPVAAPAAALLFQAPQFQQPPAVPEKAKEEPTTRSEKTPKKSKAATKTEPQQASKDNTDATEIDKPNKKPKAKAKPAAKETVAKPAEAPEEPASTGEEGETSRRRRRRARTQGEAANPSDEVVALKGSTRLEAKRMRRREGRRDSRRKQSVTEAEFLARRESVDRQMVVRHKDGLDQIAVLEDGLLVEHYVARKTHQSIVGNIYLGRVQNVLPSMEAAFVDVGRGRNAVLYAGEVNWDALGMEGKPRRIEQALKSGDTVLVQVTKDPIGHKGARLTSQITLAGRFLVLVPGSSMLGISRKLPDAERQRLKKVLKEAVPEDTGVIVRTAAEGATEKQLKDDIERLVSQLQSIRSKQETSKKAPQLLRKEPELVVRVVRDIFNEDFNKLIVQGNDTWDTVSEYVEDLSPDLHARLEKWVSKDDVFHELKIDQQLSKGMDRKVWLPSGGTLVIDRTEALTVVDVNTGKFIGSGGTLEETVTRNNLEAAEEIVRQLRLRDIGGIIIIDFVDMVLESNRELVLRRLVECLGRDRTRHQVTEITSLGLVQMTRKRVGEGLVEAFSTTCEACEGRGFIVHDHPVEMTIAPGTGKKGEARKKRTREAKEEAPVSHVGDEKVKTALSAIAAATAATHDDEAPEDSKSAPAKESATEEGTAQQPEAAAAPEPKTTRPRRQTKSRVATKPKAEPTAEAPAPAKEPEAVSEILLPVRTESESKPKRKPRRRVTSQPAKEPEPSESAKEAVRDLFGN